MKSISLVIISCVLKITLYAQTPDLILRNGKIFTADTTQLYVEALAIKDGRIMATGTNAQISKLARAGVKQIDLKGKTVVPGFNDAHNHLPAGLRGTQLRFTDNDPSWQVLIDSLKVAVKRTARGEWIQGQIGRRIAFHPEATRFELDKVAPDNPVRLLSWWGHVGIFNTSGMNQMGIANDQPDPKGGFYERSADHKTLTGKAYEKNAYWPHRSYDKINMLRDEQAWIAQLKGLTQALLQAGVTSYQNMCTGANASDFISVWKKAGLPFRLRLIRWGDVNPDGTLNIPGKELPKGTTELPMLKVTGTKWLLEGTPIEQGSYEVDAYPNTDNWHGRMNYAIAEIEAMCREAIARKDQIHFHINGSKTMDEILSMMESMNVDWKSMRPRFEHADEIDYTPEYLEKAKKLGIIVVQNPTHFSPAPGMPPTPPAKHGMALKSLIKIGIPVAIGSDGPFNPYLNIMLATTHPMRPGEAITREEAVIAYTRTSAYSEFEEQNKGTLTKGKLADLVVLSQDIFSVPTPALMATKSEMTMVGGKVVWGNQD